MLTNWLVNKIRRFLWTAKGTNAETEIKPNSSYYTPKAISSRLSRAKVVEEVLGKDLDYVVQTEERTLEARQIIYQRFDRADNYYNALTMYFRYKNDYDVPKVR